MTPRSDGLRSHRWMWVVWPAFLVAGLMEAVVFAFVDPQDLRGLAQGWALSPEAVYTLAFFVFWGLAMLSSGLTTLLSLSPSALDLSATPKGSNTATSVPEGLNDKGD
ncbi:hypothetical protein [Limnohabitans sp.]|jgi:hypothetical protein|uniref:hypothetical protein n=1 Tax=Limnohabitans sp. TaxID=1907725 RepID=UPI0037BF97F1